MTRERLRSTSRAIHFPFGLINSHAVYIKSCNSLPHNCFWGLITLCGNMGLTPSARIVGSIPPTRLMPGQMHAFHAGYVLRTPLS